MNKKGGLLDLILAMIFTFIILIFVVVITFSSRVVNEKMHEMAPTLQANMQENVSEIINDTIGATNRAFSTLKAASLILIFGYFLSILLSSFLVKTHPAFFVAYLFVVVISVIVAVPISNSYEEMYEHPLLAQDFAGFFAQSWIFLHLPLWVTVIGILAGILLFLNTDWGIRY